MVLVSVTEIVSGYWKASIECLSVSARSHKVFFICSQLDRRDSSKNDSASPSFCWDRPYICIYKKVSYNDINSLIDLEHKSVCKKNAQITYISKEKFVKFCWEYYLIRLPWKYFHQKSSHISSRGGRSFAPAGQLKSSANSTWLLRGTFTRHGAGLWPPRLCRRG